MARTTITSWTRAAVGTAVTAAALAGGALAAPPAGAATTTIQVTGATITRSEATAGTTLTVKATVARLDLWCSGGKLTVNSKATAIACNRLLSVTTTGLVGNDTVSINATGFGSALPQTTLAVKTGAGNDVIDVRHRGSLTIYAGAGNDELGAGLASGTHPVSELLLGEDGNDTLGNYGFVTATPVLYDWEAASIAASKAAGSTMRGGPGADTIVGDDTRWSEVTFASNDVVDLKEGPALLAPEEAAGVAASWTYQVAAGSPWNPDTLRFGRATALTVRCVATTTGWLPAYTINGLRLPVPCAEHYLSVIGTDRAETFDFDENLNNGPDRYGFSIDVAMLGGNDVATVKAPGGSSDVQGGDGDDRLTVGIWGAGESGVGAGANGGNGNDTLTNLGLLGSNWPAYDPTAPSIDAYPYSATLTGGPGTDRLVGAKTSITRFLTDIADTLVDGGGPSEVHISTSAGADTVAVRHSTSGSTVDLTVGAVTKRLTLGSLVRNIQIEALAGNDRISVEGRARYAWVTILAGAGTDELTLRPLPGYSTNVQDAWTWISQPGGAGFSYETTQVEKVTVAPLT